MLASWGACLRVVECDTNGGWPGERAIVGDVGDKCQPEARNLFHCFSVWRLCALRLLQVLARVVQLQTAANTRQPEETAGSMRSAIAGCGTRIVDCDADWQMSRIEDVSGAKPRWSACAKLEGREGSRC